MLRRCLRCRPHGDGSDGLGTNGAIFLSFRLHVEDLEFEDVMDAAKSCENNSATPDTPGTPGTPKLRSHRPRRMSMVQRAQLQTIQKQTVYQTTQASISYGCATSFSFGLARVHGFRLRCCSDCASG